MKLSTSLLSVSLAFADISTATRLSGDVVAQYDSNQQILANVYAKKLDLTQDLVGLHKNLTDIESVTGHEGPVGKWLESSLKSQGYNVELQEVDKDRYNVLAWPGDKRDPRLLISSHIDTVPPFIPYDSHTNKSTTTISGRGSVDAKGSVAAMIIAANSLLNSVEITPNDFAFLFVVGEEAFGDGMRAANDLNLSPKQVIFGEPTEGKLASGHKGILGVKLSIHGKAAHSGYPWLGRSANAVLANALVALLELEKELPSSEHYGVTTINIGKVQGGVAANVVAASAEANLAIRIAAGTPDDIKKAVLEKLDKVAKNFKDGKDDKVYDVEFSQGYGPVPIDADVPGFESMVVNYGTDIPNFDLTVKGQKRYLYGPGSILVAHSDHEALTLDELELAVKDYKRLILHCLQT
ncbi:Zn-dependent exopeptidase [Myriangium duriaei CBS 260.36]|uniref:Zn-dependent exopeptidase n=1 Tax=Myriangium duriaei CBS 260.36 TaxID=1168546 RepID=A0A9P4J8B7_9PEZI|nr:Zn-dependent exopeptidase [Myriangium duriaei CBS 260.36]